MTTEAAKTASDIFTMSDEEILNMPGPGIQNNPEPDNTPAVTEEVVVDVPVEELEPQPEAEPAVVEEVNNPEPTLEEKANTFTSDKVNVTVDPTKVDSNGKPVTEAAPTTTEPGQAKVEEGKQAAGQTSDFDYKSGYEKLMAPFKANGKVITPQSPEEAVSLMQMGANYTRKMQEIQPYRKYLLMLENNGLLDEGQLSYAIDLVKKNPEAIKKLVKDSGIDFLDVNPDEEVHYQAGNHRISDAEAAFATELEDAKSTPDGQSALQVISTTWDDQSKQALLDNRGLVNTIVEQKANGIYDRIVTEVERMRMLGQIPPGTAFLAAYNHVGNHLAANGGFNDLVKQTPAVEVKPVVQPVATRVAAPKTEVTNSQQAAAASPSRVTPRKAEALVNPLSMSDEDFMKLPRLNGQ
jgi:hypothetical protein